ncbi:hypothetical protein KSP39_PZI000561 [Platanthera zijinensis]|uniref:Uncharacterized protein n=1 Tax=Platanthera zijinensis TaxID=2320716 RepID=A0AAP0C0W6_9ASPA
MLLQFLNPSREYFDLVSFSPILLVLSTNTQFRPGNRVKENTGRKWVFTYKAKSTRLPLLVMASYIRAVFEHKDPSKTVQSHGQ